MFILVIIIAVNSRSTDAFSTEDDLERMVSNVMTECGHEAGLGVAVVARNRKGSGLANNFLYANGFGMKDIYKNVKADSQTLFCIGSLTKHFTSILVLHLIDLLKDKGHK